MSIKRLDLMVGRIARMERPPTGQSRRSADVGCMEGGTMRRLLGAAGVLAMLAAVCVQAAPSTLPESGCFRIHVRLNGRAIADPAAVTVRGKTGESTLSLEGGCFKVPAFLLAEESLDVAFAAANSNISLVAIHTSFFADTWEVDLADKKFRGDVSLPKGARVSEACAVVFHGGEPERAMSQTLCWTPLSVRR